MTNWDAIVTEGDLDKAKKERKRIYSDTKERIEAQAALEAEGCEFVMEYADKRYVKMRRYKRFDVQFENKVWLLLYGMGFNKMNKDASFTIPYDKDNPNLTKQIDVFAADEETVLVIECKAAEKPGTKKDFKTEIEAFQGIRGGIISSIKAQYGRSINIKFIWATSNIVLKKDEDRLKAANIEHFDERAIDYYAGLAQHLGAAAKYQLLGKLFAKHDIKNMPDTVPAIRGDMGGHTYYSFSIEPERLLKIGYVLHRDDANSSMMPTYQRIIKRSRLKGIRDFVNYGGYFPNSIIISIDAPRGLQFDLKGNGGESKAQLGVLHLPKKYCSAYIIDGQHRLYGYSETQYATTNTIPVVAFENLEKDEQVRLFMEINENQKAVPKNLRNTLNIDLLWKDEDYSKRRYALRLRIAEALGEDQESPLYDRVQIGENKKTPTRCITMDTFDNGIRDGLFLTDFKNKEPMGVLGIFDNASADNEYALGLLVPFLNAGFKYFQEGLPEEWNLGEQDEGILTNNTGIYSLLRIFSDTLDFFVKAKAVQPKTESPDQLIETCKPFFDAVIDFYINLDPETRTEIKKQYGGAGPKQHWRYLQKAIHDKYAEFSPDGFEEWWADNSKQHNTASLEMLDCIIAKTKENVAAFLQVEKGDDWQENGLPVSLSARLASTAVKKNDERKKRGEASLQRWDYATLKDCVEISKTGSYWSDGLREILTRPEELNKRASKAAKTKWLEDMQKIRTGLNRPGYSVSSSDYEYILAIFHWLTGDIAEDIQI